VLEARHLMVSLARPAQSIRRAGDEDGHGAFRVRLDTPLPVP